jgi:hypothetical protein
MSIVRQQEMTFILNKVLTANRTTSYAARGIIFLLHTLFKREIFCGSYIFAISASSGNKPE